MLGLLDFTGLSAVLGGLGIAIIGFFAVYIKGLRDGKGRADQIARDDDYENASDIRRRVRTDRDQRVRELDDAGYRD